MESQVNMLEHSEAKIRLLQLYLEKYLSILNNSRFVGDIHIYDLFCGAGIYENNVEGSPLIIIKTINKIIETNTTHTTFHCHFNDIDSDKIGKLSNYLNKFEAFKSGHINTTNSDYKDLMPEIAREINSFTNQKAFIFIDPYGYKEIKLKDIKSLLQSKKSEVLLFLPTQFMFRFESKGTPESLKEFITELIPKDKWPNSRTGLDFIENLKIALRKALGENFFVDSFIITRDINQYFCLFFFTSHILGFEKMLDSKWEIDKEEGRGWTYELGNSLFCGTEKRPNVTRFERELREYISVSPRGNGEIYKFSLHKGFRPCHAAQILKNFQEQGLIDSMQLNGKEARKSAFYLNYKEFKGNPFRVRIKYK